jgi:hypothetical protein
MIVDVTEVLDIVRCLRSNPQRLGDSICLCFQVEEGEHTLMGLLELVSVLLLISPASKLLWVFNVREWKMSKILVMTKNSYLILCIFDVIFSNISLFVIVCVTLILLYAYLLKSIYSFFSLKYFKNIVAVGLLYYLILFYKLFD